MRKYFWRQLSSLWFDRYLCLCGAVLNALAVISLVSVAIPRPAQNEERNEQRARIELEDGQRCDQLMGDSEFAPGREIELGLANGAKIKVSYKDKGTHNHTKEGHAIHMVEIARIGFVFFEVDDRKHIRRCIPSSRLDCVAAGGSFERSGDCVLAVNLPSDCELMKGVLTETLCRVPPTARILKPLSRASASAKVCLGPEC